MLTGFQIVLWKLSWRRKHLLCVLVNAFWAQLPTYDDECVVDVNAAEAVGGLADVGASVVRLHLLDTQAVLQHPEATPAAVDVASVFGPHDEGRRVALNWTWQLDGAAQPSALPVGHSLRHPGRTCAWEQDSVRLLSGILVNIHSSVSVSPVQGSRPAGTWPENFLFKQK